MLVAFGYAILKTFILQEKSDTDINEKKQIPDYMIDDLRPFEPNEEYLEYSFRNPSYSEC